MAELVPGRTFWVAFVGNEYVQVDGAPGQWASEAEAKAAAEAAYKALRESGAFVPMAAPRPAGQQDGPVAFVRDLVAGWKAYRRAKD